MASPFQVPFIYLAIEKYILGKYNILSQFIQYGFPYYFKNKEPQKLQKYQSTTNQDVKIYFIKKTENKILK